MTVIFKGGTSGNREDALPPVPDSGSPQPVLNTATSEKQAGVHTKADDWRRQHFQHQTPAMPTGGAIPEGSTDVQGQGLPDGGGLTGDPEGAFRTRGA